MARTVEGLLKERRKRGSRTGRVAGGLTSLVLHAGIVAFAIAAPTLFAKEPEPLDYVPVMLVPPQLLGVESPPRPQPEPVRTPEPEPEPQPVIEEPSPEALTLPSEEEPEPKPEPPAEPPPTDPTPTPSKPVSDPPANQNQGSATGSPVGVANTDSVIGIEDPNFTYGYYINRMVAIIRSQWKRPPLGSGVEGIIHFRIRQNGAVEDVQVVNSSGYNSFDLAALRAVQAAPLPPLPKSYKEKSLGVNLIFR